MNLSQLPAIQEKEKRRLGQGHGSGRGKTSGRGTKGQKARTDIKLSFEGGALPLIKRLPFVRGKNRNKAVSKKAVAINLEDLKVFPAKSTVTKAALIEKGLIDEKAAQVKILGNGSIAVALTVEIPVSKEAAKKIEKAGGSVTISFSTFSKNDSSSQK